MSEEDRMDRARRIRRMREGRRAGVEGQEADGEPTEEGADDATDESEETATDADDGEGPDSMDEVDEAVAEAVERVSGASAPVPSPEETSDEAVAESASTPAKRSATEVDDAVDADVADADIAEAEVAEAEVAEAGAAGDDGAEESTDAGPATRAETAAETTRPDAEARSGRAPGTRQTGSETRVLEFTLDDEQYCLDIEYVEEIVTDEQITRVPNTPEYVEGVVDLRGRITTILNPKVVIEKDDGERGELFVVFDGEAVGEQGHLGWVVDDVRQVSPVTDDEVTDAPGDDDHVNGIIDREDDDEFVVWTTPELVLDEAT